MVQLISWYQPWMFHARIVKKFSHWKTLWRRSSLVWLAEKATLSCTGSGYFYYYHAVCRETPSTTRDKSTEEIPVLPFRVEMLTEESFPLGMLRLNHSRKLTFDITTWVTLQTDYTDYKQKSLLWKHGDKIDFQIV